MDLYAGLKQLNRREGRRLTLIAFLLVCLTLGWIIFSTYGVRRYYKLCKEINVVKAENQRLKEENKNIRRELDRLKNDPAYREEVARKKFGLIKKNEIIFDLE